MPYWTEKMFLWISLISYSQVIFLFFYLLPFWTSFTQLKSENQHTCLYHLYRLSINHNEHWTLNTKFKVYLCIFQFQIWLNLAVSATNRAFIRILLSSLSLSVKRSAPILVTSDIRCPLNEMWMYNANAKAIVENPAERMNSVPG